MTDLDRGVAGCMLAMATVGLLNCGGETSGSGTVPLEDMPARVATLSCQKLFQCCSPSEIASMGSATTSYADEESCRVTLQAFASLGVPIIQTGIDRGRVIYRGDRLASCLDQLSALTCEQLRGGAGSDITCEDYVEPLVEPGGICSSDMECTTGHCTGSLNEEGVCDTLPVRGEPCDGECAEGSYCDFDVCVAPQANGSPCIFDEECASDHCSDDDVCAEDTFCGG